MYARRFFAHASWRSFRPPAAVRLAGVAALLLAGSWLAAEPLELRIGNVGEPLTLDPQRYNLNLEEKILADLFEGLAARSATGRIEPGAAERWSTSDDGLVWTFHLRRDGRWSDGAPVTAHDFVYALRRLFTPRTAASLAYFLYAIEAAEAVNRGSRPPAELGVSALDDWTLEIRLAAPFPFLLERLVYPIGSPVPRHVVEPLGDDWVKPGNMVSNGAFVLEAWRPHGFVRAGRNPHFRERAPFDAVVYFPIADRNAAYSRYRSGELDIVGDFPPSELGWLRREMPGHVHVAPRLSIMYLVFNTVQPPFDDARVRRALALAIDRETIATRVLGSGELPSAALVPPMVEDYVSAVGAAGVDRNESRRLLAAAGYGPKRPLAVELRHIADPDSRKAQVAIAAMWKEVGVDTVLHHAELKAHFAELRQGNFQVAQAGWFGGGDPEHYLELLMSTTGDVNYGRFANAQVDALMAGAKAAADLDRRLDLLREAESVALALHPVVPLYAVTARSLVRPRLTGWHANARDIHPARHIGAQGR